MTCAQYRDQLDDYLAGRLSEAQQQQMRQHVQGCEGCRDDLEAARMLAGPVAALRPGIAPPADLWPHVARRIAPARWRGRILAAAAAIVLMAASSLATAVLVRRRPAAPAPPTSAAVVELIQAQYAPRAEALEAEFRRERPTLAPETVATIERNLTIIDRAITESRDALERDPSNPDLRTLFRTGQAQRVALLEQATRIARDL